MRKHRHDAPDAADRAGAASREIRPARRRASDVAPRTPTSSPGNEALGRLMDAALHDPGHEADRPALKRALARSEAVGPTTAPTYGYAARDHSPPGSPAADIRADTRSSRIHRHASWEHKMLGDVDPDVLEIIASGKDVAHEEKKKKSFWSSTRESAKTIQDDQGRAISLDTVLHTMDQEIRRLKLFQSSPPEGTVTDATAALQQLDADARKGQLDEDLTDEQRDTAEQEIDDAQWDVRLVELTLKDGKSFLVTYGELNTLADFYGSAKDDRQRTRR